MKLPKVPQRTTQSFAFSMIDRALQECLAKRKFGQNEIREVLAFFGDNPPRCVYCGGKEVRRWDHLASIKLGGETVLGNMVPACQGCDDSKRHLRFEEWMISNAPGSPKSRGVRDVKQRIERLKAYAQHFDYRLVTLQERLDKYERRKLETIHLRLQELRDDFDVLVGNYRARTGNK